MEFSVKGHNGNYLKLKIIQTFGFPKSTSPFGGYDTKSEIEIKAGSYFVTGELLITTGNIYEFFEELKQINSTMKGCAKLVSYENNLITSLSFDEYGHLLIIGEYQEKFIEKTLLKFEIKSDQSYLNETMDELDKIYFKFGDNKGVD